MKLSREKTQLLKGILHQNKWTQGDCYAIPKILATSESIEVVVGAGPPVERVVDVGEQDVEEEAQNSKNTFLNFVNSEYD